MLAENPATGDSQENRVAIRLVRNSDADTKYQIRLNRERRSGLASKRLTVLLRKSGRMARFRAAMRYEIGNLVTHSVGLGLAISGTIIFSMDRVPYNHMMWHVFVLAGSVCHFISPYKYV
jgi:predicted membrane channel-forming protein YqfA (hemolysin III family)